MRWRRERPDDLCCRDLALAVRPCEVDDSSNWLDCLHRSMFRRRYAIAIKLNNVDPIVQYLRYCPWCGARLYPLPGTEEWIEEALDACLEYLATDQIYIAPDKVEVLDHWKEGVVGLCVIYRHPWTDPIKIGYRSVYQADPDTPFDEENPTLFGDYTAAAILEPLGTTRGKLQLDENGVGWHGDLAPLR